MLRRDEERCRYELAVDGDVVAFAEFSDDGSVLTIPYIETAIAHRGHGFSATLMDGVIDDVRTRGLRVLATCPVARAHINARASDLLADGELQE